MSTAAPNPYESPLTVSRPGPVEPGKFWQQVEIEYELNIDDYVVFNMHHIKRSPGQRYVTAAVWLGALVIAEIANAVLVFNQAFRGPMQRESVWFHLMIGIVFLVVFGGIAWRKWRSGTGSWYVKRLVRNMLTQGDPSALLGKRLLRVTPAWVEEVSDLRESRFKLQCVQRIDVTPQYAFIYVAPVIAFILPVKAFPSPDEFGTFIANLEGHTGKVAERMPA